MKKLIEVTRKKEFKETIEVEFPIYRLHDVSGDNYECVIYSRIEDGYKEVSIKKSESYTTSAVSYELEIEEFGRLDGTEYGLGLGEFASTKDEFNSVLAEFKAALERI